MTKASLRNAGPFESVLPSKKALSCAAGETIFTQGDDCEDIHYIERGVVKLTLVSSRGRGAVLGILGIGRFHGRSDAWAGATAYATSAVAIAPSTLHAVGRARRCAALLAQDTILSARFVHYLLARQQRIEQDLADHLLSSSEKRLARMLLPARAIQQGRPSASYPRKDHAGHACGKWWEPRAPAR